MGIVLRNKIQLIIIGLCIAFITLFVVGCGNSESKEEKVQTTKVVTDLVGNEVIMPKDVNKIAIVPIPWATIVYAVDGSGDKIAAMHPSAKKAYEDSILKTMAPNMENANATFVDNNFNVNYEELAKLKPDVVVIWDYQPEVAKKLKELGIPSVQIKYGTLEDIQKGMILVGNIINKPKEAEALVNYHIQSADYFKGKQEALKAQPKKKVLYLRDEKLNVAAKDSVNTLMIESAGGINVAKDISGQWKPTTMEQILAWNPDVIVISNFSKLMPEDLYNNKITGQDWSQVKALQTKQVYKAPMGIYRWDAPAVETPLMMRWLGKVLQPEVFNDYSMSQELKSFYHNYLKYDLSEEEVNDILKSNVNPVIPTL